MTPAPFLQIEDIVKDFGTHRAVDHVSIDIVRGELFALLGSSGSGKTTLLRMLAGFETPSAGRIRLEGRDLAELPPYARPMNMMFQSYALFPHLSVRENVAFGLRRDGMAAGPLRERVDAMLSLVQLTAFASRKPHQLSGGQQQRVALARSLAKKPQLLLLDEPLGALDKKLREETQFQLAQIIAEVGVTCVMVTHDQEEAMTMATRLAVMSEGRLLQVGPPGEIYETPASRFVADFIGNVNLMEGTLLESREAHAVVECASVRHHVARSVAAPVGASVTVAVRPEKIVLSRELQATDGNVAPAAPNRVRGTVKELAYFGSYTVYHLLLPDGTVLKVSQSNTERELGRQLHAGDLAWASWSPESQVVLTS